MWHVHLQVILARGLTAIDQVRPDLSVAADAAAGILDRLALRRTLAIEASVPANSRTSAYIPSMLAAHHTGVALDMAPSFLGAVHQTLISGATALHRDTYCAGAPKDIESVWEVAIGKPSPVLLQPCGHMQPLPHGALAFPVYGVAKLGGAVGGGAAAPLSALGWLQGGFPDSPPPSPGGGTSRGSVAADGDLSFHVCLKELSPLSFHGSPGPGEL